MDQNQFSNFFNKKFGLILASIFYVELFSFFGFLVSEINIVVFFAILLLTFILSFKRLEYGILILLTELFIGSKGYLFFFEYNGLVLSIRIALWLIIMSVWLGRVVSDLIKTKKLNIKFLESSSLPYFLVLFIFIIWGVVNGIKHNEFSNVFFDFNGWLYFALVFPFYEVIKSNKNVSNILQVLTASVSWLIVKTFFLAFIFSHVAFEKIFELYRWVRVSGVGEITNVRGGFNRIFFQSHIFILIGFFLLLFLLYKNKKHIFSMLSFAFLFSLILITFSRSFWLGLLFGLMLFYIYIFWQKSEWQSILRSMGLILISGILSIGFIFVLVYFPYPKPIGGFDAAGLLASRATSLSGEAAVSSRWALLPEVLEGIKEKSILGKGFGATVTYITNDPRVLEASPTGEYTTYALEWGWLDIWLKLGIFGILAYLILIGKILVDSLRVNMPLAVGLMTGLIVIAIVSIFSPYLNHPLGIGYLVLTSAILNSLRTI